MSINIGIIGYGNLGKALEQVILSRSDCKLVAIFSRRLVKSKFNTLIESYENISLYRHKIDIMMLCGGSSSDIEGQTSEALLHFDCINSFDNHKKIISELKRLNKLAVSSKHRLIMACGWDPGLFSNIRSLVYSISKTKPYVFWGKGVSMGHSEAIKRTPNVIDAIQFTVPNKKAISLAKHSKINGNETMHFRECFVVADKKYHKTIEKNIRQIPNYFKGQATTINFVSNEKLLKLHSNFSHQGEIVSQFKTVHGSLCSIDFKLKMNSNPNLTASIMAGYINAIINLKNKNECGAFTTLDIPPIYLFKPCSRYKITEMLC